MQKRGSAYYAGGIEAAFANFGGRGKKKLQALPVAQPEARAV
jgi:hypothetical protein